MKRKDRKKKKKRKQEAAKKRGRIGIVSVLHAIHIPLVLCSTYH